MTQQLEWLLTQHRHREPVGERRGKRDGHRLAGRERCREAGRVLGLDADHRDVRAQRLHGRSHPGEKPAAAHRNDDRLDRRQLLEDFERHRALAGDDLLIVERVDEREPFALCDLGGLRARLSEIGAVEDDGRTERAAIGDLDQRRELRHHDRRRDPRRLAW